MGMLSTCQGCKKQDSPKFYVEPRYSLGIFAGYWCDACWKDAPYRKEGREGFDPIDAGEQYEEEDY